jgi:hypothetical protein
MDKMIKFPTKLPSPGQLELPRVQLTEMLHELNKELVRRSLELMKADNAAEFGAVVRKTLATVSEASNVWKAFSDTIRDSWRI